MPDRNPLNHLSRRQALSSLTAVAAAPVIGGSSAIAGAPHPDAALFALIAEAELADARADEAYAAECAADERIAYPPLPKALIERPSDRGNPFISVRRNGPPGAALIIDDHDVARFRGLIPTMPSSESGRALAKRLREIVDAWDAYRNALQDAREISGLEAAQEERDRALHERQEALRRVALAPAQTAAGIIAKLRAVTDDLDRACDVETEDDQAKAVLASAALDAAGLGRLRI